MNRPNSTTSAAELLSQVLANVSGLVRSEVDLARAEINENLHRAFVALGLIAGALVFALIALNVLTGALVVALSQAGIDPGWAALIVGVVFGGVAFAMLMKGINDLKLSSLAPTRTAKNVQRDARAVKEAYNDQ